MLFLEQPFCAKFKHDIKILLGASNIYDSAREWVKVYVNVNVNVNVYVNVNAKFEAKSQQRVGYKLNFNVFDIFQRLPYFSRDNLYWLLKSYYKLSRKLSP